jgi:hypothetical protein
MDQPFRPEQTQEEENSRSFQWTLLFERPWQMATVVIVAIVLATGLLSGGFYSSHLPFRQQTEAFLEGRLELSRDVRDLSWDLVWDDGAVQQVWGLGVPALRTPFEAIAKLFHFGAFPDRLIFVAALFLTVFVLLRFNWRALAEWSPELPKSWIALASIPLVLSPPLLTFCMSKFQAYEETVAYGFLASILLMIWTVRIAAKPCSASFAGLCLCAGLLPFIRPTFVFYGVSSVLIGAIAMWKSGRRMNVLFLAPGCFGVGIALLLWTNSIRFGSPAEFGHSLNMNSIWEMRYAARFADPFQTEPFTRAALELFSVLFMNRTPPGPSWPWAYQEGMFWGQSPTFRFRELYLSTFDLTWLAFLLGSWSWLALRYYRLFKRREFPKLETMEVVCLWSIPPVILLAIFYLRFPFISSRYLLDFAPALVAGAWVGTAFFLRYAWDKHIRFKGLLCAPLVILAWWGYEVFTIKVIDRLAPVSRRGVLIRLKRSETHKNDIFLPNEYVARTDFEKTRLAFNGSGWDKDESAKASILLSVEDPECLILDIAPNDWAEASYDFIQAKIGLEFLEREGATRTKDGMRIWFRGPKRERYQTGIQQVALAMMKPEELNPGNSRFRLLKVSWHSDQTAPNPP